MAASSAVGEGRKAGAVLPSPAGGRGAGGEGRLGDKAAVERGGGQHEALAAVQEGGAVVGELGFQAVLGEVFPHGLPPAQAFGGDQNPAVEAFQEAFQLGQGVVGPAVHLQGRQGRAFDAGQLHPGVGFQGGEEIVRGQEQVLGGQQGPVPFAGKQAVAGLGVLPEGLGAFHQVAVEAQGRFLGQVVEQGGAGVEEQGQVILDAPGGDAVGHVLVEAALGRVALEGLAEFLPEVLDAGVVQGKLPGRQQADFAHRVDGALGVHVEGANGFDLVAEQVQAVGHRAAHGEEVDQAAPHRVFAGAVDLGHVVVAGHRHLAPQGVQVELLSRLEEEGVGRQVFHRRQAVEDGGQGGDHHVALPLHDLVQGRQALGHQVVVGGELVVGQGFPVRQQMHRKLGGEPGHLLPQPLGILGGGGEYHQGPCLCRQGGQQQGVSRAAGNGKLKALAGLGEGRGIRHGVAKRTAGVNAAIIRHLPCPARSGVDDAVVYWN